MPDRVALRYVLSAKGGAYSRVATYGAARDAGMCCAWSPAGTALATASQDGLCIVWELRMGTPLMKARAHRVRVSFSYISSVIQSGIRV